MQNFHLRKNTDMQNILEKIIQVQEKDVNNIDFNNNGRREDYYSTSQYFW